MSDLVKELSDARQNYVREAYADKVKAVIQDHLSGLRSGAEIEDTLYFNHSAIPDFVMTWDGGKVRRDVYIRSSYASIMAAEEPKRIKTGDPIFLSLDEEKNFSEPGLEITERVLTSATKKARHTLLTDTSALAEISAPADSANPLSTIVRSNFLRGARGFVDEPIAEKLVEGGSNDGESGLSDLIRDKFFDDALFRMERTAALMQWVLADSEVDRDARSSLALEGSMSNEELANILPWILRQDTSSKDTEFWSTLGSMLTFEQLEQLSPELEGIDITALVGANSRQWSARRAYLGLNVTEDGTYPEKPVWAFIGGTLALGVRGNLVRVSYSGHKLKSRNSSTAPRWETIKSHLSDYKIQAVSLSGIERAFRIDAKQSENIREDITSVTESLSDDYFVDSVELNLPVPGADNEYTAVEVDFGGSLAIAGKPAELASLARVGLKVIGHGLQSVDGELALALNEDIDPAKTPGDAVDSE